MHGRRWCGQALKDALQLPHQSCFCQSKCSHPTALFFAKLVAAVSREGNLNHYFRKLEEKSETVLAKCVIFGISSHHFDCQAFTASLKIFRWVQWMQEPIIGNYFTLFSISGKNRWWGKDKMFQLLYNPFLLIFSKNNNNVLFLCFLFVSVRIRSSFIINYLLHTISQGGGGAQNIRESCCHRNRNTELIPSFFRYMRIRNKPSLRWSRSQYKQSTLLVHKTALL